MTNSEKIIKMMSMASPGGAPVWIPESLPRFKASKPIPGRTVLTADSGSAFCAAVVRREGPQ